MGNGTSSNKVCDTYQEVIRITGGAIGGLEDTIAYGGSVLSSEKQKYIKKVAEFVAKDLKMDKKIPNIESATPEELVKAVLQALPDPRNKSTFGKSAEFQTDRCKKLAKFLNKLHGRTVIDENASAKDICKDSAELLRGMMSATTSEIEAVHVDLERIINNLNQVGDFQDQLYSRFKTQLETAGDADSLALLAKFQRLYDQIVIKRNLLLETLAGMTDSILSKQQIDLNKLAGEAKFFESEIDDIGDVGTSDFAKNLAYSFLNLATVADAINQVDKSLKILGMSFAKYKSIDTLEDLNEELSELQESKLNKLSEKELSLFLRAAEILRQHQYMHDDIVKDLASKKEGGEEPVQGGLNLDKRVEAREKTKSALLKSFNTRLDGLLKEILRIADLIGRAVFKGDCPLGDNLMKFVKILVLIPDLQERKRYFSITGFYDDIESRQERETFCSILHNIMVASEKLYKCKAGPLFKDFSNTLGQVCELIDTYVDKFSKGFGPLTSWEEFKKEGANEIPDNMPEYEEEEFMRVEGGAGAKTMIITMAQTLENAIDKIKYSYRVQMQKHNMEQTAKEMKAYSADYKKVLGIAIAHALDEIQTNEDDEMEKFKEGTIVMEGDHLSTKGGQYYAALLAKVDNLENMNRDLSDKKKTERKEELNQIKKYINDRVEALRNLYRTAEAIDTYLVAFTDAITSNPDNLQDIIAIMGATEVISQPFDSESGDSLCRVYECFPGYKSYVIADMDDPDNYNPERMMSGYYNDFRTNILKDQTINRPDIRFYSGLGDKDFNGKHYYEMVANYCRLCNFDECDQDILKENTFNDGHNTWSSFVVDNQDKIGKTFGAPIIITDSTGFADTDLKEHSISLPGNPFLTTPIGRAESNKTYVGKTILDAIEEAKNVLNAGLVKNLVSVFISIGGEFGGKELINKTTMSAKQIYTNICDYITYSSFGFKFANEDNTKKGSFSYQGIPYNLQYDDINKPHGTLMGEHSATLGKTDALINKINSFDEAMMRGAGMMSDLTDKNIPNDGIINAQGVEMDDIFSKSDDIFVMIIKSMMAKILTVIGAYKMYNKPIQESGLGYSHELRTILGAASDTPKIIVDAIDLYIRMIPMVESYREIFSFDDSSLVYRGNVVVQKITMVPEMTGMFSGLIKIVFDKARYVENGNYSLTEIKAMINEINNIYNHFKNKENPIMSACLELRDEINRRYGIISDEERKIYKKERDSRYDVPKKGERIDVILDYELNAIDENDVYRRPAPSDSYRKKFSSKSAASDKPRYTIKEQHKLQVQYLREKISKMYDEAAGLIRETGDTSKRDKMEKLRLYSLESLITSKKRELLKESDQEKQFNIVLDAINSLGGFSSNSLESSYILFHETVVFGLDSLFSLYKDMLLNFNLIKTMSVAVAENMTPDEKYNAIKLVINMLLVFKDSKLIGVRIETNESKFKVVLDISKLRDHVYSAVNAIKSQLDRFRAVLPEDIIKKYEDYDSVDPTDKTTLYNLEKHFVDELIEGRYQLNGENPTNNQKPLESINMDISNILDKLTDNVDFDMNTIIIQSNNPPVPTLIDFDGDASNINKILFNNFKVKGVENTNNNFLPSMGDSRRYVGGDSLINRFNGMLYDYLNTSFDIISNKMYISSVDNIMNGSLNSQIFNRAEGFADDMAVALDIDRDAIGILYHSNAKLLDRLFSARNRMNDEYYFLETDLSKVPLYLKNKLVIQYETYKRVFEKLLKDIDIYQKMNIVYGNNDKLDRFCSDIIRACMNILTCISNTLKDFSYESSYGETQRGYFEEYKILNGDVPFTPLSNVLYLLHNPNGLEINKYLHALRPIYDFTMSKAPGVKKIIEDHNRLVDKEFSLDVKDVEQYYIGLLDIINHIDIRAEKDELLPKNNLVFCLEDGKTLSMIISMFESPTPKNERAKLLKTVCENKDFTIKDRNAIRIFNFMDLNIVPVNVHALMREIPLINLYNYSYTYDKMIKNMFNVKSEDNYYGQPYNKVIDTEDDISTYQVMGELLMYPNRHITEAGYEYYIPKMMRGAMGVDGYGRPKFLAEEVFNKALFGEIYGEDMVVVAMDSPQEDNKYSLMKILSVEGYDDVVKQLKETKEQLELLIGEFETLTEERDDFEDLYERATNRLEEIEERLNDCKDRLEDFKKSVSYVSTDVKQQYDDLFDLIDEGENAITTLMQNVRDNKNPKTLSIKNFRKFVDIMIIIENKLSDIINDNPEVFEGGYSENKSQFPKLFKKINTSYLVYHDKKGLHKVPIVNNEHHSKQLLKWIGKLRFDTKFTRNLVFLTNNMRMLRRTLAKELMHHEEKVVTQHALLSTKNIELFGHPVSNEQLVNF